MSFWKGLAEVMRAIFKQGDPIAYVCLALVVCLLTLGWISIYGTSDPAVAGFTVVQGLMAVALWLALGLIVLAFVRLFR